MEVDPDSPRTKQNDERERQHFLRQKERHPAGRIPVEDPRGRALEHDFEIDADAEEFLPPEKMLTINHKIRTHIQPQAHIRSQIK